MTSVGDNTIVHVLEVLLCFVLSSYNTKFDVENDVEDIKFKVWSL